MISGDIMNLQINCTQDGTKKYPLHKHNEHEIMVYLWGEGYMHTPDKEYPFVPGSIIIIPAGTVHGSVSEEGFRNISVSGEFRHLLHIDEPVVLSDNERMEGTLIAKLLYENRFSEKNYLMSICNTFVHFLLHNMNVKDSVANVINKVISDISENFYDCNICLSEMLKATGYAEDYARQHFKRITGKTPIEFLTEIRIKHACYLIDIYAGVLSLNQIAEKCGYIDYVYFSKKFKSYIGVSPFEYKRKALSIKEIL